MILVFNSNSDYSKSESDKRTYYKQSSSGSSPLSDNNEQDPEGLMRRVSIDVSGQGCLQTENKGNPQQHRAHLRTSGTYITIMLLHKS